MSETVVPDAFTAEEQDQLNAVREATGSDKRARFAGVSKANNTLNILSNGGSLTFSTWLLASRFDVL